MQEQDDNTTETTEVKPTITIAEKEGSGTSGATESDSDEETSVEAKPTITIAERQGGE